ncbi:hypothetical protein FACS1894105_01720 [Clostridia bacterium]|nr:hypothetical protein FACS1894105_01720 [Clostridia bacterium]
MNITIRNNIRRYRAIRKTALPIESDAQRIQRQIKASEDLIAAFKNDPNIDETINYVLNNRMNISRELNIE